MTTATVANYGTITGTQSYGVYLGGGGGVANLGTSSLIAGAEGGLLIKNDSYTATTSAIISNAGTIEATGAGGIGIDILGVADNTVVNAGTIVGHGGGCAVVRQRERPVNPRSWARFSSRHGRWGSRYQHARYPAFRRNDAGTITGLGASFVNFGSATVDAGARWTLANGNMIAAGVTLTDNGALTNSGALTGSGALIVGPGTLVNNGYIGPSTTLGSGSRLDNTGTISDDGQPGGGGKQRAGDRGQCRHDCRQAAPLRSCSAPATTGWVLSAGAAFIGTVYGGGGTNTLDLAAGPRTGTISGLGSEFVDFASVVVDSWRALGARRRQHALGHRARRRPR